MPVHVPTKLVLDADSPGAIRCPGCRNKALQKSSDGALTLRPKGPVRFEDDRCFMKCFYCDRSIELPLALAKSEDAAPARVVLRMPARR